MAKKGRPSAYKEQYKEQAYKLALLGLTDVQMANVFGVSEVTFNAWKKTKEGFLKSLNEGKVIADGDISQSLYNRAKGYEVEEVKEELDERTDLSFKKTVTRKHIAPDPTSMIFWLKNRQPHLWRDKQEIQHDTGKETQEAIMGFLDKKAE